MVRLSGEFYAAILVGAVFGWPYWLFDVVPGQPAFVWLLWAINSAIGALTWHYTTSRDLGFFTGMSVIAGTLMSGCANLTFIYLPFILAAVYVLAAGHSLIGIFKGRAYTQHRWVQIVLWFTYLRRPRTDL